jgi:hypothetical protein
MRVRWWRRLGVRLRHDGFDPHGQVLSYPADVETQCENCFRNISRALEQAGASLDDLVRVVIFVTSQEEFERIILINRKQLLCCATGQHHRVRKSRSATHARRGRSDGEGSATLMARLVGEAAIPNETATPPPEQ